MKDDIIIKDILKKVGELMKGNNEELTVEQLEEIINNLTAIFGESLKQEIVSGDVSNSPKVKELKAIIDDFQEWKNELTTDCNDKNLKDFIEGPNSNLYHALREALASKGFSTATKENWPEANLTNDKKTLVAIAQLKPDMQEIGPFISNNEFEQWKSKMAKNVLDMDDLTADVLDIISSVWLKNAKHYDAMVDICADDFLRIRGLQPKLNGEGRHGGYRDDQRAEIARQIDILSSTWITVNEMMVTETQEGKKPRRVKWRGESRAIVVTSRFGQVKMDDSIDAFAWRTRPGDVFAKFLFGPGRQTALLSQRALEYHPINQKWEKRLTRYLAWIWRNRSKKDTYFEPFNVEILLDAAKEEIDKKNPSRTKERLETALNRLESDKVIEHWEYDKSDHNESIIGKRGWWKRENGGWLSWKVLIEPPIIIIEQYSKIRNDKPPKILPSPPENFDFTTIRITREQKKLNLSQAAEQIGISVSRLSRIERGQKPSKDTQAKIQAWITQI